MVLKEPSNPNRSVIETLLKHLRGGGGAEGGQNRKKESWPFNPTSPCLVKVWNAPGTDEGLTATGLTLRGTTTGLTVRVFGKLPFFTRFLLLGSMYLMVANRARPSL